MSAGERGQKPALSPFFSACAFSIFVHVEIVRVFLLAVNAHPSMI
jgi:hypothetical protein